MKQHKPTIKYNTSLQKIIEDTAFRALANNSKAKSITGQIAFVKKLGPDMSNLGFCKWIKDTVRPSIPICSLAYTDSARNEIATHNEKRRMDADAKRAANDKAFRKRFARKLKREAQKLAQSSSVKDFSDRIWYNRDTLQTKLEEISRKLKIAQLPPLKPMLNLQKHGVACVSIKMNTALAEGADIVQRGKDWQWYVCVEPSHVTYEPGWTKWDNGRAVKYTRACNDSYVRSVAKIEKSGMELNYLLDYTLYSIVAPPSFHWEIDNYGVKLMDSTGADYHPSGEELILPNASAHCCAQLLANASKRARLTTNISFGDVRVCMQDSIDAGNCEMGSSTFAYIHGLNVKGYYPPELLLRIAAPGEEKRVRLAIAAAINKHKVMTDAGATIFYPPTPIRLEEKIKIDNDGCIRMS